MVTRWDEDRIHEFRDGNFEIYVMDFSFFPVEEPNQVNITNNAASDGGRHGRTMAVRSAG